MNLAKYVMTKLKRMPINVVSENSSSKNVVNFQEKHPLEIAFWSKAAGYLTVTVNILMGNLWNFQSSFHKNSPQTAFCNQLSLENVSTIIYFSKSISIDFSYLCFYIQWHAFPGINRSSHRICSRKKGVLRNFVKFIGKYMYLSLFFNKVAGLSPATLLKMRLWHRCFPVNFAKFLRTTFLQNTFGRLLPN